MSDKTTPRPWSIRLTGGKVEGVPAAVIIDKGGAWVASTSEPNAKLIIAAVDYIDQPVVLTLKCDPPDPAAVERVRNFLRQMNAADKMASIINDVDIKRGARLTDLLDTFEHRDGDVGQVHFRHPDLAPGAFCRLAADGDTIQHCLPMPSGQGALHVSRFHLSISDLSRTDWEIVDK